MATLTVAVDGVGANDAWTLGAGASKQAAVNQPDDDDTTYITASSAVLQDLTFENPSLPGGSIIDSVTIYWRSKVGVAGESNPTIRLYNGLSFKNSINLDPNAAYVDQNSGAYTTAPDGTSWDTADLNGMFVRFDGGDAVNTRLTTVYAVVDYTVPGGPTNLPLLGVG